MKFLNKLFGEKHQKPAPATTVTTTTNPEKAQRAVELAEKYINMEHPVSPMERTLGVKATKPIYKVQSNQVVRGSSAGVDMKIVSVATCLPKKNVNMGDQRQMAKMAFDAIYHYASLSKVYAFFSVPFLLKQKIWVEGTPLPPEEQCRLLAGVENLLLEIYEELPQGGTFTDAVVERKIDQLIVSIQVQDSPRTPPPQEIPVSAQVQPQQVLSKPAPKIEQQIIELLRQGKKIDAIRFYRQHTSAGLNDAKDFVEKLEQMKSQANQQALTNLPSLSVIRSHILGLLVWRANQEEFRISQMQLIEFIARMKAVGISLENDVNKAAAMFAITGLGYDLPSNTHVVDNKHYEVRMENEQIIARFPKGVLRQTHSQKGNEESKLNETVLEKDAMSSKSDDRNKESNLPGAQDVQASAKSGEKKMSNEETIMQYLQQLGAPVTPFNDVQGAVGVRSTVVTYMGLRFEIQVLNNQILMAQFMIGYAPRINAEQLLRQLLVLNSLLIGVYFCVFGANNLIVLRSSRTLEGLDFVEFKQSLDMLCNAFMQNGRQVVQMFQVSQQPT